MKRWRQLECMSIALSLGWGLESVDPDRLMGSAEQVPLMGLGSTLWSRALVGRQWQHVEGVQGPPDPFEGWSSFEEVMTRKKPGRREEGG